jgi:hypothetical protein
MHKIARSVLWSNYLCYLIHVKQDSITHRLGIVGAMTLNEGFDFRERFFNRLKIGRVQGWVFNPDA